MNRTRAMLAVYVDLDPIPGTFHTADSARNAIGGMLKQSIPHYTPLVSVVSYGRQFYDLTFDHNNPNWTGTVEYNMLFVKQALNFSNEKLAARGYLFLNEVLEVLGLPKTREGQLVGWTRDNAGPISYDWQPIGSTQNLSVKFHTDGVTIDKAFDEDRFLEYAMAKQLKSSEEDE